MTPQELFVEGAEATAQGLGERHGYSMLVGGLERMLREHGYDFSGLEMSSSWHYPLVEFANQAEKPESLDVRQIAKTVDAIWLRRPEPSWDARAAIERRDNTYVFGAEPNIAWIESQVAQALRTRKIRRGTKKYLDFVTENAAKVFGAIRIEVEAAAKRKQDALTERLTELVKRKASFVSGQAGLERTLAFRKAMLTVTGVEPDARSEEHTELARGYLRDAISSLDETINYLQLEFAAAAEGFEERAREAALRNKELAPFVLEPPTACSCEG